MYAPSPPQLGPIERMLIEAEAREEQERLRRFKRQVEYYQGDHRRHLKRAQDGSDDNVIVNAARSIVDKGVSFLFGKHLEFVLESERDGQPDQNTKGPAEQWLDDCWDFNQQDAFLLEVGLNGARNGHAFVKVMQPQTQYGERYPRLINLDPATVTARHDPHDLRDVNSWRVQFTALDTRSDSPTRGKLVTFRQEITRLASRRGWEIADWESLADSMRWMQIGPTVSWPYPNSPICHCKNLPNPNVFLGLSDLESDVLALVDARNFLLSNTQRIIRYHAHPKTIGKGFLPGQALDVAADGTLMIPSKDGELYNLEMQSDLASSLAFDQRLDEGLHQLTRIPPIAVGKVDDVGRLSGAAISLLYQPLLEMTETKRVLYGVNGLLGDINALFLAIGKFPTEQRPTITWPALLPKDILEERQALLLDQQMGVASTQTLAEKLGYDWEQEVERREEEAQNMGSLLLDQMAAGTAQGGVTNPQATASTGTSGPRPTTSARGGVSRGGGQNG